MVGKMHAVFMLYGSKVWVDFVIEDLQHTKLPMTCRKEGEPDRIVNIQCQIRTLPGGIFEFVFPKEHADAVLTTLRFHQNAPYDLGKEIKFGPLKVKPFDLLRKYLKIEPIPEFKTDKQLIFPDVSVSIIPIGVRYDTELTEPDGYVHEAI